MRRAIIMTAAVGVVIACLVTFYLFIDFDRDGLSNLKELLTGTGVFNPDTDGDELWDGQEVNTYGTNPLAADSDGDGLEDGIEVNGSWHLLEIKQKDGVSGDPSLYWTLEHGVWIDGELERQESWQGNSWRWPYDYENILVDNGILFFTSDPLSADTDKDGLSDSLEYEIGTNPVSQDTDNDGFQDAAELDIYKTLPFFFDTDGDLLSDREEKEQYLTDPLDWDCDKDHLSDGIEVKGCDANGDGIIDVDFPELGANPFVRDIFVEIDWMPGARTLGSYAKGKLIEVFASHGMTLHFDQGEFGGGSETEESVDRLYDNRVGPMNDFFDFKEKYFSPLRRGVFFWCLITSGATYVERTEVSGFNYGDGFTLSGKLATDAILGSAFMHEIGHGLGLDSSLFDGIDSKKYPFDVYTSVMNYNAPLFTEGEFFDYSEGAPFNDWAHLNFKYINGRLK